MGFCRGVSAFFVCFVSAAVGFFGQSGVFSFLVCALGEGGLMFPRSCLAAVGTWWPPQSPCCIPLLGFTAFPLGEEKLPGLGVTQGWMCAVLQGCQDGCSYDGALLAWLETVPCATSAVCHVPCVALPCCADQAACIVTAEPGKGAG